MPNHESISFSYKTQSSLEQNIQQILGTNFNIKNEEVKNYTFILGNTIGGLQLDLMDLKEEAVETYIRLVCDGLLSVTLARRREENRDQSRRSEQ